MSPWAVLERPIAFASDDWIYMGACKKPTIVFLASSLGVGGSETKVVKLANSFARAGEKVEIDLLERDLVLTSRNRVQPDATSCDLPCK